MFVLAGILISSLLPSPAAAEPVAWDRGTIADSVTWSGEILLKETVVVGPEGTLKVLPGTKVLVAAGKGITVLGGIFVEGTEVEPVRFLPEKGDGARDSWEGIRMTGGSDRPGERVFSFFSIEGAKEGISMVETSARISGGTFRACTVGIQGYQKSEAVVERCLFAGNRSGAMVSLGGRALFRECRFEENLEYGLMVDRGATVSVRECDFGKGKTGIFSLTNAPFRVEGSLFRSLGKGVVARQVGKDSGIFRCRFENNGTGVLAVQFCTMEISDSEFEGNTQGVDVREFSTPAIRHNRFTRNQDAVNLFRKSHARVEGNLFTNNRNAVVVNFSSYPHVAGNSFDRNDMAVRLEKFQSGDWEERVGSPKFTAEEAMRRGSRAMPPGVQPVDFPKAVDAKGNWWGPDAGFDPEKGTLEKIWDGKDFGPVTYEGFGEERYAIDTVDFSGRLEAPAPDAGPRKAAGSSPPPPVAPAPESPSKEEPSR